MNPTVLATTLATVMATSTLAARRCDSATDISNDSGHHHPHDDDDVDVVAPPCRAEDNVDAYRLRSEEAA